MPVTKTDLESLAPVLESGGLPQPQLVYHIYKNRRSRHADAKLWCIADLGTCRVTPVFLTDNHYAIQPINDTKVIVQESINFE